MNGFLATIVSRLRWLFLGAAGLGVFLAYLGWTEADHIRDVEANGVEAVARIESATRTKRRRGGESVALNLTWRDAKGSVRTAEKVAISNSYAARVIRGGTLIAVDKTRIKFIPDRPDTLPIVLDDIASQQEGDQRLLTVGLSLAGGGALGAVAMFLFQRRRRSAVPA